MQTVKFIQAGWLFRFQGLAARAGVAQTLLVLVLGYGFLAFLFAIAYWSGGFINGRPGLLRSFYFSIVTQTTLGYGDLLPVDSSAAMAIVILQSSAGLFLFALASALMVLKLLHPVGNVFRFDRHAVFYPVQGLLRIRVINQMPASVSHVEARAYLRTWLPGEPQGRFGTYDIPLKRSLIPQMEFLDPWNLATRPADHMGGDLHDHEKEPRPQNLWVAL